MQPDSVALHGALEAAWQRLIGAFDGALTVLGIIIGAYAVGASEAHKALILSASIGACPSIVTGQSRPTVPQNGRSRTAATRCTPASAGRRARS